MNIENMRNVCSDPEILLTLYYSLYLISLIIFMTMLTFHLQYWLHLF